jgi:plasmid maintenance system antidote protein VapI
MPQMSDFPFRFVHFSPAVLGEMSDHIMHSLKPLLEAESELDSEAERSLAALTASEILKHGWDCLPGWVDAETHFLILADVPEPALFRLPTILRIHKPDQRIHVTRDPATLKRQAIALNRDPVFEGLLDAYLVEKDLFVVHGDLSVRAFPLSQLDFLSELDEEQIRAFQIHTSGSFLQWPSHDLRVGASQLLQAVDPMFLADVAIERYSAEKMSLALRALRRESGLTQSDIPGVSDRHVRRLENEEVRLTAEAAEKYARALGTSMSEFLEKLGRKLAELRDPDSAEERDPVSTHTLRHAS